MTPEMKAIEAKARSLYPVRPAKYAIEMAIFEAAWERGHSHGEASVLDYYSDFAAIAQKAINATTEAAW